MVVKQRQITLLLFLILQVLIQFNGQFLSLAIQLESHSNHYHHHKHQKHINQTKNLQPVIEKKLSAKKTEAQVNKTEVFIVDKKIESNKIQNKTNNNLKLKQEEKINNQFSRKKTKNQLTNKSQESNMTKTNLSQQKLGVGQFSIPWGFTRNIINIDTFFAAPKSEKKQVQIIKEVKELKNVTKKEEPKQEDSFQKLKEKVKEEAALNLVQKMMLDLGEDVDEEEELLKNYTIIYAFPSNPENILITKKQLSKPEQVSKFFAEVKGLKMLFDDSSLLRTNVHAKDNELEYYRLLGAAYSGRIIPRQKISFKKMFMKQKNNKLKFRKSNEQILAHVQQGKLKLIKLYSEVVDGIPKLVDHPKKGAVKIAVVQDNKNSDRYTLFSQDCAKTMKNKSDCYLALGYILEEHMAISLLITKKS